MYVPFQESSAQLRAANGAPILDPFQAVRNPMTANVLVVEDSPSVRRLCAVLLERAGCAVLQAGSAACAADLSRDFAAPIHLLVCDVVLPDADGRQLAQQLAAARPGLRILMLSGYPEHILAAASQDTGSAKFLAKPFAAAEFVSSVRSLLLPLSESPQP